MIEYYYKTDKENFRVRLLPDSGPPCSPYYPEQELDGFNVGQTVIVDYSLTNKRKDALNPKAFTSKITYLWVDCYGDKLCLVEGRYTAISIANLKVE